MATKLPFNKQIRHRCTQTRLGYRPRSNWSLDPDELPAPWAEGDIVEVADDAICVIGEADGYGPRWETPGLAVIAYVTSIDEGDAWYVRLCNGKPGDHRRTLTSWPGPEWECSDRLHIAHAARSTWDRDLDWMAGVTLVDTADPDGLAERERMLAEGWSFDQPEPCPTCGRRLP